MKSDNLVGSYDRKESTMSMDDELYLASLELPYVKGAKEGEDSARDAALRQLCDEMGEPCLLDPPPASDDVARAVDAMCTYLEQADEHEDWLCRTPHERANHVWQHVLVLRRWLVEGGGEGFSDSERG